MLIKAANNPGSAHVAIPNHIYSKDVNFERAVIQLQMLPDVVKTYKQSQGLTRLEVTSERTIGDGKNGVLMAKDMFSEIDKLLHLYFTIPVTIRTTERSFSCLRHIKNYLRSSMTEERLTEQCHSLVCSQGGNRSS